MINISKNSNLTAIELLQKLNTILRSWARYFSVSINICLSYFFHIDYNEHLFFNPRPLRYRFVAFVLLGLCKQNNAQADVSAK